MRPCYTFIAASDNTAPTLSIFDEIGFWGMQAKDFLAALAGIQGDKLDVEISSPGGDVFAAVAMYNGLRASGKEITTKVMGVAASAASLVFMAGDKRVMPKNTHLMVHNPWSFAAGNAVELRDTADMLDKVGTTVRGTYASRSGMTDEAVTELLSKNTWLTADEALANGMATEVIDEVKANAVFDMARADLPEAVRAAYMAAKPAIVPAAIVPPVVVVEPPEPAAFAETALASATAAGFEAHAPMWALACTDMAQIGERIAAAREITALCMVTKHPDQAEALIKANTSVVQARAALVELMARADELAAIDTSPHDKNKQAARSSAKPKVSTASLWASHNAQSKK